MTFLLRLTAAAQEDLRRLAEYLDQQDPRIGDLALIATEQAFARIERNPLLYPRRYRNARRALVPRYRFVVWYRVFDQEVVVFAVLHGRRDPRTATRRVPPPGSSLP